MVGVCDHINSFPSHIKVKLSVKAEGATLPKGPGENTVNASTNIQTCDTCTLASPENDLERKCLKTHTYYKGDTTFNNSTPGVTALPVELPNKMVGS